VIYFSKWARGCHSTLDGQNIAASVSMATQHLELVRLIILLTNSLQLRYYNSDLADYVDENHSVYDVSVMRSAGDDFYADLVSFSK